MRAAARNLTRSAGILLLCLSLCACAGMSGPTPASAPAGSPDGVSANSDAGRIAAAHAMLGDLQLRTGRADLAAASYAKSLSLRTDAGVAAKRGRALLRLGQAEPALASFDQALASLPEDAGALAGRGESLYRLGRAEEALDTLSRSEARDGMSWRARCLRGLALEALGRPDEAVGEYLSALALPGARSGRLELLNNLGVAQAAAGDVEAGVSTLRAALRDVRPGEATSERIANNLGLLLARLGRYNEALAAFRAPGDDARALNNMGCALLQRGETDKARALFERALDASPRYYEAAGENLTRATLLPAREKAPAMRLQSRRMPLTLLEPAQASYIR